MEKEIKEREAKERRLKAQKQRKSQNSIKEQEN